MFENVRDFIDRHIKRVSAFFDVALITLWILSQYIPALPNWMINQNLLTVIIAVLLIDVINR